MTFESMIDAPPAANEPVTAPPAPSSLDQALNVENDETVVVKVLYGTDLRRTACVAKYAPLLEVCSKLFGLPADATVLKYQDEDGDKITMSSDEELNEARALAKEKILRVFVENKHAAPIPPPPVNPPPAQEQGAHAPMYPGLNYDWPRHHGYGGMRGGFGHHRGGFGGRGFHHGFPAAPFQHHAYPHPHPPHHPHPHPPHHPLPHPHPPFMGGHFFPHGPFEGHNSHSPVQTTSYDQPQQSESATVTATFSHARMSNHGVFSPAGETPLSPFNHCRSARAEASPYAHCWKERKNAMKEHVRFMKANCTTEEDRQALKIAKRDMYNEFKEEKQAFKEQHKNSKYDEKKARKEEKYERKCGKKDKKDKKEKKEKREKCGKKDKKEKLIARHVADVTIPDNSELPADTPVTKTWRLRNSGYIAWPADSQLVFVSRRGDDLNGPERVFVGAVEPSQEVEVSVTFVTPTEPGRYIGYYRMATADGKFGQRVWVSFIIPLASPAAPMTDATDDKSPLEQENKEKEVEATKDGEQAASAPSLLDVQME